jgi:GNAT superfamily N-acetyltransferase
MASITIRRAQLGDAQRIGDLTVQAYVHGGHLEPGSAYVETLQNAASRIDETFVAVDDTETIIGAISLFPTGSPGTEIASEGEAEFRFLAIDPKYWGQDIGRTLIAYAEDAAQSAGITAMVLRVIDMNPRGLALYEHLGYVREPDRDWTLPPRVSACGVTNATLLALRKPLVPSAVGR